MTGQYIPWGMALAVFLGSLPIFAAIVWNLIEVKSLRGEINELRIEMNNLRGEIRDLAKKVGELAERVSKIEGKIEGRQVIAHGQ